MLSGLDPDDIISTSTQNSLNYSSHIKRVNQGGTKASHKRGQITLGVFPNCRECQKIDSPVLKKPSAVY